jgi:hypothetical protein
VLSLLTSTVPMKKRLLFGFVLVVATLACWLFPISWLAAPQWEVVVVDERGKPVEGMTVRETWKNYSVEMEGREADRQTDVNGRATFPAQKSDYSVPRQIAGTMSALAHLNAHSMAHAKLAPYPAS